MLDATYFTKTFDDKQYSRCVALAVELDISSDAKHKLTGKFWLELIGAEDEASIRPFVEKVVKRVPGVDSKVWCDKHMAFSWMSQEGSG